MSYILILAVGWILVLSRPLVTVTANTTLESSFDSSHSASPTSSATVFETNGLFGADYSSVIMATIGENPSDNALHAGGYGSIMSAIGPSPLDKYAQDLQGLNGWMNGLASVANPVSTAYQTSLLGSNDVTLGLIGHGPRGLAKFGDGAVAGVPAVAGPVVGLAPATTKAAPAQINPITGVSYLPDPYGGIGTTVGLGTMPQYATANNIVGPAFGGKKSGAGCYGLRIGFDESSATTISSRINHIPQAVAGGRIVGSYGGGLFLDGMQTVSAFAEAPGGARLNLARIWIAGTRARIPQAKRLIERRMTHV